MQIHPEAILFDMDGVLVDVSNSYRIAIKKTAEFYLSQKVSHNEIQEYKNRGGYNDDWDLSEAIILSRGKKIPKEQIVDRFQKFYLGNNFDGLIQNETWLLDNTVLMNLKKGYSLGIVTGRPRAEAEYALRRFGVDAQFEVLITLEDTPITKRKPHPYGIHLAMQQLAAKEACYIGDTVDDVKAAMAAGITPICVTGNDKLADASPLFKELGVKYVIAGVNEIMEILA